MGKHAINLNEKSQDESQTKTPKLFSKTKCQMNIEITKYT